jgi:hypothetical protein
MSLFDSSQTAVSPSIDPLTNPCVSINLRQLLSVSLSLLVSTSLFGSIQAAASPSIDPFANPSGSRQSTSTLVGKPEPFDVDEPI